MFPTSGFARRLPCLLSATKAVVAKGRRPCRQHRECFPARHATTAANPDPIMLLIVCLFASPPVTDDGSVSAVRASPRQQPQRECSHPQVGLVFRLCQCDKENQDWREGPPLTVPCQSFDLPAGPSPSGKFKFERKKNTVFSGPPRAPHSEHWPV